LRPEQLRERRHARAAIEGIPLEPYASIAQVNKEYHYAERLCEQFGWRRIEVTGNSVEEVSRKIITLLGDPN
jgi:regulator of PEP synthase PpsR (kinase-PPPase family)